MVEHILTLLMLIVLQAVLGFDNLLYISLESKHAPAEKRDRVRNTGILIAIGLRIILLIVLVNVIKFFEEPWLAVPFTDIIEGHFSGHSLIVLGGGVFILYTATKEIAHIIKLEKSDSEQEESKKSASVNSVIFWIVVMNVVFSFDSILSAMALTDNIWVMSIAIFIGGLLMMWLSDRVADFLEKNKMYEVMGLFILFVVGIMLLTEGAHLGHLKLFGNEITAMSKTTFYFVIVVLILTDLVQSRYQKKLNKKKENS